MANSTAAHSLRRWEDKVLNYPKPTDPNFKPALGIDPRHIAFLTAPQEFVKQVEFATKSGDFPRFDGNPTLAPMRPPTDYRFAMQLSAGYERYAVPPMLPAGAVAEVNPPKLKVVPSAAPMVIDRTLITSLAAVGWVNAWCSWQKQHNPRWFIVRDRIVSKQTNDQLCDLCDLYRKRGDGGVKVAA